MNDKPRFETPGLTTENVAKIAELFPGVVAEGKVNFDLLRSMLGEDVFGDEAYEFTWVGKRAAIAEAGRPIRKTLRPCVEESKDWDTTENLYIEGDNLDVLKLLQESYLGKVKMIYIDPPYNTGNDFIYRDDFKQSREDYDAEAGVYDEDDDRLLRNTETNGRFHSDWCSMIYPRLVLARNLLSQAGMIFISIDDKEVENLRKICDEVFGESNFVAQMVWQSTPGSNTGTNIITVTEYILVYAKIFSLCNFNTLPITNDEKYTLEDEYVEKRGRYILNKLDRRMTGTHYSDALNYPIEMPDGQLIYPGSTDYKNSEGWNYRWSKTKLEWGLENGFIVFKKVNEKWNAYFKQYLYVDNNDELIERSLPYQNFLKLEQFNSTQGTREIMSLLDGKKFDYPKPMGLVKYLVNACIDKNAIILDFFSGSSTTAHAVMQLNAEDSGKRKFIMVQLPEVCAEGTEAAKAGYKNICEIGKERIRRAGEKIKDEVGLTTQNLDIGFRVLKLDDTNMNDVYYAAGDYTQDMLSMMESNIKSDRTDMDLLYGCLLDRGLPLSMPHTHENIDGFTVHTYNDGDLIACFEEHISEKTIREIAGRKPLRAVFRDSSFTGSSEKINVFEIFKLLAPNTNVRVI